MPILRIRVNGRYLDLTKERVDIEFGAMKVAFYHPPKKSDRGVKPKYDKRPKTIKLTSEQKSQILAEYLNYTNGQKGD